MKRAALASLLIFSACAVFIPNRAVAQADDFNDGNDLGWTRYDPIPGGVGSYTFTNGGYRIQTRPTPNPAYGNGRAGSVRTEVTYTNFYVEIDIINWDDTLPQSFGILARCTDIGLGQTKGYAFTHDRGSSATSGDVDISRLTGEAPSGVSVSGSDQIHFVPGQSYRLVFIGVGPRLEGRVYQHPDLANPVVRVVGSDATYESGVCGLVAYDNSRTNFTDVTFDNYLALDVEPPRLAIAAGSFGDIFVSWAAETPDTFVLQTTPSLSTMPIVWTPVTGDIVLSEDGTRKTYNDTSFLGGNKFYRMARP